MAGLFDPSVFEKEMLRIFRDYRRLNKRAAPALLINRTRQLAVGSGKGVKHKGLYQEAKSLRPMVQTEIKALPQKLSWRIKRYRGSVKEEIRRRLIHAATFQATGWIDSELIAPGIYVKNIRGRITMVLTGNNPSITLTNTSPRAFEFGQRTGYIARAFYNQTQDMLVYIQKHLDLTAAEFSKKYPNFRQPIEHFMP